MISKDYIFTNVQLLPKSHIMFTERVCCVGGKDKWRSLYGNITVNPKLEKVKMVSTGDSVLIQNSWDNFSWNLLHISVTQMMVR